MVEEATSADREVLYVLDPMCSWCWGFSPVIEQVVERIGGQATVTPLMGGLRPCARKPMSDATRSRTKRYWLDVVAKTTGQHFDIAVLDLEGLQFDTEPSCRAVVVVRQIEPAKALAYLAAIQRGFYTQGRDITDGETLARIAEETGIDGADFRLRFNDVASAYETAEDFHAARKLGVTGYPTVIVRKGEDYALLSAGFQSFDAIADALDMWLSHG